MKMFKFFAVALAALGLMAAAPVSAATTTTTSTVKTVKAAPQGNATRNFVRNATIGNGFEIMSSRIALQRSRNPEVRDFAQRMINDHGQADDDLRNAVMDSRHRVGMPNDLDNAHRGMLNRLQRAEGENFDRLYISMQVKAHRDAVALFSSYARNGNDRSLREFARNTLPTLQEHKDHLRHIRFYR